MATGDYITETFVDPKGRAESFMSIRVPIPENAKIVNFPELDPKAKNCLNRYPKCNEAIPVMVAATICWAKDDSRAKCIADHESQKRSKRWVEVQQIAERIRQGIVPEHGHVYLHPSVTGEDNLIVIDGTRRMLGFLEAGKNEVPVIVVRAGLKEA